MNISIMDIIKLIIPVLTSLAVCYITLYFTNKRNKETLNFQQKNHLENMEIAEKKYKEQIDISEENERLKYLPYLTIIPKSKLNKFEGEMNNLPDSYDKEIPFELVNEGAGIAFSIRLEYLDDNEKPNNMQHIALSFKNNYRYGYDIIGVRTPIDTDILRVQNKTDFDLYLTAIDNTARSIAPTESISWKFNILFTDIQEREYIQTFSFYTSTKNNKIVRVNSYMPKKIK